MLQRSWAILMTTVQRSNGAEETRTRNEHKSFCALKQEVNEENKEEKRGEKGSHSSKQRD